MSVATAPAQGLLAGTSPTGRGAALAALLVAGSAVAALRFELGGLFLHPYLLALAPVALMTLPRWSELPGRLLLPAGGLLLFYFGSLFAFGGGRSELVKIGAALITTLTVYHAVRSRPDVRLIIVAMALSVAALSARGLLQGEVGLEGINPLQDIANKNAFSLYTLPALLLCGYLLSEGGARGLSRWAVSGAVLLTVVATFATANRSGWLGVILIGALLLAWKRRFKATVVLALLSGVAWLLLERLTGTEVIEHRLEQTTEGYSADAYRLDLFFAALKIGLRNPLLGVSPARLPYFLAEAIGYPDPVIDPHNVLGHIIGGAGLFAGLFMVWLALELWRGDAPARRSPYQESALALTRIFVLLWLMRGMFSREILYSPNFAIALGVILALGREVGLWASGRPGGPDHSAHRGTPARGAR